MALKNYLMNGFMGLDQSQSENSLTPAFSPEAHNIDVSNGDLAVAKGYVKQISTMVPGDGAVSRMYLWHTEAGDKFVVIAGKVIYAWSGSEWIILHTFTEAVENAAWDFLECRIGNTDYLIMANGVTGIYKWDGTMTADSAVPFGSGEWVYESTIASVHYNMQKAMAVTETITDNTVLWTLTMPDGYAYEEGAKIAFVMPQNLDYSITAAEVNDGINTYTLDYVPGWAAGNIGVIELTSMTEALVSTDTYGIDMVALSSAIDAAWKQRALDNGMVFADYTYKISAINEDRTEVTLDQVTTEQLAAGDTAKVRGGISNNPVGFVEIYFSRLFSAGDPEHPSRLYWSQPPGDTRSIEDWSEDEASEITSGGHVEVGNTSSDPIVGLIALSNQLVIFKKSSVYRLIGDRPSNYQIVQVNAGVEKMTNTGLIRYADTPFWMTGNGLMYYDGNTARITGTAKRIRHIIEDADLEHCKAVECKNKLYYSIRTGTGQYDNALIELNMDTMAYMLRDGFNVADIAAHNGKMYMINDQRYVYQFDTGDTYDGEPIEASWRTPKTDLSAKSKVKMLRALYCRGTGDAVIVRAQEGTHFTDYRFLMPLEVEDIRRMDLRNECRVMCLTISNEEGSAFKLIGGLEVVYDTKEDFG